MFILNLIILYLIILTCILLVLFLYYKTYIKIYFSQNIYENVENIDINNKSYTKGKIKLYFKSIKYGNIYINNNKICKFYISSHKNIKYFENNGNILSDFFDIKWDIREMGNFFYLKDKNDKKIFFTCIKRL